MTKSESIYSANVWWTLAADNLTFEEVMGDFKKSIPQTDFKGKKLSTDTVYLVKIISFTETNIAHDVYNAGKKSYTVLCQGKNF